MIDEKILLEQIKTFKRSQKSTNCDYLTGYISALSAVEGMIAEQPKVGEWIPCSEKLPEDGQKVIFTDVEGGVEIGYYEAKTNWCVNDSYFPNAFSFVAWIPILIPEPYKGGVD